MNGIESKLLTLRTSLLDSRTQRNFISDPLTHDKWLLQMRSKLRPLASRTEGCISWGKKIQFAFKCHLHTASFILTTQVIEIENVKVQTLRNFTPTLSVEEVPSSESAGTASGCVDLEQPRFSSFSLIHQGVME